MPGVWASQVRGSMGRGWAAPPSLTTTRLRTSSGCQSVGADRIRTHDLQPGLLANDHWAVGVPPRPSAVNQRQLVCNRLRSVSNLTMHEASGGGRRSRVLESRAECFAANRAGAHLVSVNPPPPPPRGAPSSLASLARETCPSARVNDVSVFWGRGAFRPLPKNCHFASTTCQPHPLPRPPP